MNPVYTIGTNNTPRHLNIQLIPDNKTKSEILQYLWQTKLTGWPMQSNAISHLHCTILDNAHLLLPVDFNTNVELATPIDLSQYSHSVKPLSLGMLTPGAPVAILLRNATRVRTLSDLLHKKFKLRPEATHYIFHISITKVQIFKKHSKQYEASKYKAVRDYMHLPPYEGRLVFNRMITNYDNR
jgi:hypothetical protein